MRNITRASVALVAAVALTGVTAMSASAAVIDEITVQVSTGNLELTGSTAETLTAAAPGSAATATIDAIQVTDNRAGVEGWGVNVSVTDFVNADEIIPATAFTYSPTTTTSGGEATLTDDVPVVGAAPVDGTATAVSVKSATNVHGNNDATWSATYSLLIPADALALMYSGTVTHSLA